MKVSNSTNLNQPRRTEVSSELQEGDVVKATIKEKLPNNEAIVQVKGKNVQVKLEGNIPKGDNVTIEVTDTEGNLPTVKVVSGETQASSVPITDTVDAMRVIRGLGETPTTELKLAVSLLMEKGLPIDRQLLNELKTFLDKSAGTMAQKLETLQAVINKQAPLTFPSFAAVHQALHGESLGNLIQQLLTPTKQDSSASLQQDPTLQKGTEEKGAAARSSKAATLRNTLKEWNAILAEVEQTPKLDKTIARVKNTLESALDLNQDIRLPLHKAVKEAEQYHVNGRTQIAKSILSKAMDGAMGKLEQEFAELGEIDSADPAITNEYDAQAEAMQGIALTSKDLLVTQITRRLGEAAESFKNVQREIVRKLDNLEKSIPQARINVLPQVKPLLESTIDMLDRTILKSELTMFTDMSMEKTLMKASTSLSEARKLLDQGDNQKATQLINEVKQSLDKLNFKPSITKVQHFLVGDQLFQNDSPPVHKLSAQLSQMNKGFSPDTPSARATFEFMRSMGLNHESEVAQALAFNKEQIEPQDLQRNLKATMLQVLKQQGETTTQRIGDQPIDKLFNNLTGQQLLNKSDTQSSTQSFFFQLPVMLGAKPEDVKVYINGRKEGEKIDWENCSFYFLLDTKKLGETGIMLNSVNRNLSISIRNDRPNFKESMQPMVERCKERLKEVGYNISHVQFEKLTQEVVKTATEAKPKEKQESEVARFVTGQKGYDFKI